MTPLTKRSPTIPLWNAVEIKEPVDMLPKETETCGGASHIWKKSDRNDLRRATPQRKQTNVFVQQTNALEKSRRQFRSTFQKTGITDQTCQQDYEVGWFQFFHSAIRRQVNSWEMKTFLWILNFAHRHCNLRFWPAVVLYAVTICDCSKLCGLAIIGLSHYSECPATEKVFLENGTVL